jgi:predicted negative regulator of RcsB-dependent stress response
MFRLAAFVFLSVMIFPLPAQEKTLDWYVSESELAESEERYEGALSLLEEGKKLYPQEVILYKKAGDLYYYRQLYRPALREYLAVEGIAPDNGENLYQIAQTYGYLNENENSLTYFEKLLVHPDYSTFIVDDLAWMYYKTHKFRQGEELLLSRLEEGFNKSYAHTLGTIYSGQYRHDESRKYYLMSIDAAESDGSGYFASIACYNLSLLEFAFYQYEESLKMVKKSLDHRERAGGYTALGDLYSIQLDFPSAHEAYTKGMELDDTPLSRMGMAELYLNTGALTAAGMVIAEMESDKNRSWMYYYGTEPKQYEKNLHELEYRLNDGLYYREKGRLCTDPVDWLKKAVRMIRFRALSLYHRILYRDLGIDLSRSQRALGNTFDADWYAYQAAMGYRSVSLVYLEKAERFEKGLTPLCNPWYDKERGRETGNPGLLEKAAAGFNPLWERAPLSDTLQMLARIQYRFFRIAAARNTINRLYAVNPGGVRSAGLSLPLILQVEWEGKQRLGALTEGFLFRGFRRAGVPVSRYEKPGFSYRFHLKFSDDGGVLYLLTDNTGQEIFSGFDKLPDFKYRTVVLWLNRMILEIHSPRLMGEPVY